MTYRNAGISFTNEEIQMADKLAKMRHLNNRTALIRQLLYQEWERIFGTPNAKVTVAMEQNMVDQEQG